MTNLALTTTATQQTEVSTTLNSKFMENKLKLGWAYDDFANHFCLDKEGFIAMMEKTFSNKRTFEYYSGRLKENDRKKRRNMNRAKNAAKKAMKNAAVQNEASETIDKNVSDEEKMEENREKTLEQVIQEADEVRKLICGAEADREKLYSKRRIAYANLSALKDEMIKIRETLKAKAEEVELEILGLSEIAEEVEKANSDIKVYQEMLYECEEKINSLKKVIVKISESSFGIEPEVEIPESWKELRDSWIDDERFEDLTMAELRQLAKAVALKDAIEAQNRSYEVMFTSDKLQGLFEKITAK